MIAEPSFFDDMKVRSIRKLIFAGLISAVLFAMAGSANAQGILKEILDRMDAHNKALTTLRSDVTMVKADANLGPEAPSVGSASYLPKTGKRAMYIRLDWTAPVAESMVVIGDSYKLYRPKLGQVYVGKVDKAKNKGAAGGALAFIGMSKDELRANYEVKYVGQEQLSNKTEVWHLELIPKVKSSYKSAELWVDKDGMPVQAKVIAPNNDTTTVLLTNIRKNTTIDAAVFKLSIPSGVKEIKG
jgi:outer membrane lipoprotein-sorting protein